MTWDELAKRIADMDKSEKEKIVLYREPWQDQAETFPVDIHEAEEDIVAEKSDEIDEPITIKKGEYFLQ